jgi:hypothetical protein
LANANNGRIVPIETVSKYYIFIEEIKTIAENKSVIAQVDAAIDKIDIALPTVKDLEASDVEMDELAELATNGYKDFVNFFFKYLITNFHCCNFLFE